MCASYDIQLKLDETVNFNTLFDGKCLTLKIDGKCNRPLSSCKNFYVSRVNDTNDDCVDRSY